MCGNITMINHLLEHVCALRYCLCALLCCLCDTVNYSYRFVNEANHIYSQIHTHLLYMTYCILGALDKICSETQSSMFQFYKTCSTSTYHAQWQPVCFSPPDWAAALCEWRAEAPASRCQTAGRWTAAGRSSDTPDWPRSSPSPGFALDAALHSLTTMG